MNYQFQARFGVPLFRSHSSISDIAASIHRFRALDQQGVFSLAKDISRLIAEAIDTSELHRIAPPQKAGVGTGSMKSLERVLTTITSPADARNALTYLVGIYELRGADAHLPSAELDKAFELAGVDKSEPPFQQGMQLLFRTMQTLSGLYVLLTSSATRSTDA